MSKFKTGDEVIAIHDNERQKVVQGDRFIVRVPRTLCCGGFIVEGSAFHLRQEDFELFKSDGEKTPGDSNPEFVLNGIPEDKVLMVLNRMSHLALSSVEGHIPIPLFATELNHALVSLGIREKWNEKFGV